MTTPSAKLLVFVSGRLACVKIQGRANFTSSLDFKNLLNGLIEKGFTCFVLDLTDCLLMDSTFLGVMAGFGLKMRPAQDGGPNEWSIELLNPNARISDLLENLGVLHLFHVVNGPSPAQPEGAVEHAPAAVVEPTREQVSMNCLEAHKTLMDLNPANVPKFKEVTQFLIEDLKKLKHDD
jgi:anti-sigma B factor antagonist